MRLVIIMIFALIGISCQKDYYDASNKNVQRFDTELEEQTARYLLDIHDKVKLTRLIANITKTNTRSEDLFAEAERIEKIMSNIATDVKVSAAINRITLADELSQKSDKVYNKYVNDFQHMDHSEFMTNIDQLASDIILKADKYIDSGSNEKIQKLSLEVRNKLENLVEMNS